MNTRLRRFLSYYKPHLGLLTAILLCAFVVTGISLTLPLLTRYITGTILQNSNPDAYELIIQIGIIMAVLIAVQAVCAFFVDYQGHKMGAKMENEMRRKLFDHYQKLSFRFFDGQKTGQLMSRITNDLLNLAELYHHGPEDMIIYIIRFIGALIILFTISWKLTLVIVLFLPLMLGYTLFFSKKLRKAQRLSRIRIGDVNSQVEDTLSGIRIVKSFTNEALENQKFKRENDDFMDSRNSIYLSEAWCFNGMDTFGSLASAAIVIIGGIAMLNAQLGLPDLLAFVMYIGYLLEPVKRLTFTVKQYQEGISSFERFMEMMEIEPEIEDVPNALKLEKAKGQIAFQQVSFRYREDTPMVVKDITFTAEAGEYLAIVGASGVGKTTLCSLIPRFYEVNEGTITLDGINIKDIALHSLRKNIGVVQQDIYLFDGTIRENIRYGRPDADDEEIMDAAKKANAHDFIMAMPEGYDTAIGQRGVKLSGGQKQRLSIARVFLKNPPVLIFDEATSALDNESEKVVQESLEALAENRTAFVIAHRLSTIRNAQRILVLSEDGIAEEGCHQELMMRNGIYAHLYNMQFDELN